MKRIALALIAAAGLAVTAARADHVDVRGSINFGGPAYVAPAPVYGPAYASQGYWRDVTSRVWVPPHWESRSDYYGRAVNEWEPGHYELRTQRVWVAGDTGWRDREHWEHERMEHERMEHMEHERREHEGWGWGR